MNNRLLKVTVILSVFALAGTAFVGTAAAQASGAQINDAQPVQGDQSVTLEFDAANTNDHIIGIDADDDGTIQSDEKLKTPVFNPGSSGTVTTSVTPSDAAELDATTSGTFDIAIVEEGNSDGSDTTTPVDVSAADTTTTLQVDPKPTLSGATTVADGNAVLLQFSETVTGVEEGDFAFNDNDGSVSVDGITFNGPADAAVLSLDGAVNQIGMDTIDADAGDGFTDTQGQDSPGTTGVGISEIIDDTDYSSATTTQDPAAVGDAVSPSVPASAVGNDADLEATHLANDSTKALDTTDNGRVHSSFPAVKDDQSTATDESSFTVSALGVELGSLDYTDPDNYKVVVSPTEVIHGETATVEGEIYRSPTELASDRTVDYALQLADENNNQNVVANSDTSNGEFIVRATFDNVDTSNGNSQQKDYPDDDGSDYTSDDAAYVVTVSDSDNPKFKSSNEQGSAVVDVRLDVSSEAEPQDPEYRDSTDFTGNITDGPGNPVTGYGVTLKDPAGGTVKSTNTAGDGSYGFTATTSDAGDWSVGTNEGGFVNYRDIEVDAQNVNLTFTAQGANRQNFPETYEVNLQDDKKSSAVQTTTNDGGVEGYINVTGPFASGSVSDDDGDITSPDNVFSTFDPDGDTDIEYIYVETDSNGEAQFTATPIGSGVTADLENQDDGYSPADVSNSDGNPEPGLEVSDNVDAADTPDSPDYVATRTISTGASDPVNIQNDQVQDARVGQPTDVSTPGAANYQALDAAGPDILEVLPYASSTGDRIINDQRLGIDTNQNLAGMTVYRVSFQLADETNSIIAPDTTGNGNFDRLTVTGAGIDGTIVADATDSVTFSGTGILDARYATGPNEYQFLIRPTEVSSVNQNGNATIDTVIDVRGENNVTYTRQVSGLNISEFQVDGNTTEAIEPNQVVDVTSVVEDATAADAPINNGRVRLSQNGTELANFDARTQNTNDGEYSFDNVSVGPRGFDTDDDGIGEQISTLDFTAYQYADANNDQALQQKEVNKAAVEQLGIAIDDTLQVDYVAENTSKYSGDKNGTFTLTRGVEYDQIAFELTEQDGTPVDLTEGLGGNTVGLNSIAQAATGNDPELVTLTTPASGEASVNFDTAASNPSNGYYVISDIEEVGNVDTSTNAAFNDGDSFVFGSSSVDDGRDTFTLNIETPDRSQATNASETGTFVTEDADVDTEVAGVAGNAVPNSVSDTDNNGNIIDEVNNDQTDWTEDFNTSVSGIETPTANVDRLYRINATVTDALGTPLNNSDYSDIRVDFDGSVDPTTGSNPTGDNAKFEMVNGPDVAVASDDGVLQLGDTNSGGASVNDEAVINNQNGTFQFDIEVESAGDDGTYTPVFEVEAQANTVSSPVGKSDASQSPDIVNPVVNVFGENGGELPVSQTSDNQILANNLQNQLRIEVFPADEDGFVLPSGLTYALSGSFAETQVSTSTQNINSVQTAQLATEGFDEGQIGFLQATPTGTGVGFASLRQGSTLGPLVRDTDGNTILFDVLSTNRGLNLELTPSNPTAADDITVTATDDSTGDLVDQVSVTVESPTGNTTTVLTEDDGEAVIPSSFTDESGTYDISTRRAGYSDASERFSVSGVPDPAEFQVSNVAPDGATVDQGADITVTADIENVGDQTGEQDVEFRLNATGEPLDDDAVIATQTVNLSGQATTTVSFDVTAPANNGTFDHGVFTNDDSATATLEVQQGAGGGLQDQVNAIASQGQDSTIERSDIVNAIDDFFSGDSEIDGVTIERAGIVEAIDQFFS